MFTVPRTDVMTWIEGQPCSQCGESTTVMLHQFDVSKRSYYAPLYHLTEYQAGFCGPACATAYVLNKNKGIVE